MAKIWALALVLSLAAPARAVEPANTLSQLFWQLNGCLSSMHLAPGTDVTVQFELNRRGAIIGRPRITHAHWPHDADPRQAAAAIAASFDRCLPATISDSLGGAIAGRLIAYRLRGRAPAAGA